MSVLRKARHWVLSTRSLPPISCWQLRAGGRAKETPIGWVPRYKDMDWTGMDFSEEKFDELQAFDRAAWRNEVLGHEELFIDLHAALPKELVYERELLICRM